MSQSITYTDFDKVSVITDTLHYVFTDHLGSVTEVVNSTTGVVTRQSFDAWGNPRSAVDWRNAPAKALFAGRGFTGHEHLIDFDLINMNGRVYDPTLSMFLSPDNYIQTPGSIQGFNRYGYCLNNPLKYTDPDGQWFITFLTTLANMYLNGSMNNDWEFNPAKWDWGSSNTWLSLVRGGISGYYMGSNLENKFYEFKYESQIKRIAKMDYIAFQETGSTQLPEDFDLYGFQEDYFPKYYFKDKVTLEYDNESVKLQADEEGNVPSAFTSNTLVNGKYEVLFGEGAYKSQGKLYLTMGHEFVHVAHFEYFGASWDLDKSEYGAYIWNAGYLHNKNNSGWTWYKKKALEYGDYDLSRNSSYLKVESYLINNERNYGLPYFNYYMLFE